MLPNMNPTMATKTVSPTADMRAHIAQLIEVYGRAWTTQDSALILTIFTPDASYHERVFKDPMVGHAAIKKYWDEKVCVGQADIKFKLVNLCWDAEKSTATAEWEATFRDTVQNVNKHMKEAAFLVIRDGKICALKEFWSCKEMPA